MYRVLDPRAEKKIIEIIENATHIDTEQIVEIIKPHLNIDMNRIITQIAKKQANRIMRKMKGDDGLRKFFAYDGQYVNVETTNELSDLTKVEEALTQKIVGLTSSRKKVNLRYTVLKGQLSLEDLKESEAYGI